MSSWTRDQTEHHLQSVSSLCDLALAFFYTNPIPESKFDRISKSPKGSSVRPTIRMEFCFPPEDPNI